MSSGTEDVIVLSSLTRFAVNLLKNEDGPTAVEYAVMLALIIVVCIAAITTLGQNAMQTFTSVGTTLGSTSS
jgi:pilus assembly protein Flp/PilA